MIGQLGILTPNGIRVVACQTGGGIPKGLALTLVPMDWGIPDGAPGRHTESRWSVTHIQSGMRVGPGFEQRGDAQRCAEALAEITDWTMHAFALRALNLEAEIDAALDTVLSTMDARADR